ncbi:MAG: hypothetical protein V1685_04005 [Parcubacteria group bacterium]
MSNAVLLFELRRGRRVLVPNPGEMCIDVRALDGPDQRRVTNYGEAPIRFESGVTVASLGSHDCQVGAKFWQGETSFVIS